MNKTNIEWTDYTLNPFRARSIKTGKVGHFCEKISPGCGHCYASEWNENRMGTGLAFIPQNRDQVQLFFDESKLADCISRQKPSKIFWGDMTDVFLEHHETHRIDQCFATMALTPQHTHQILTKRPERMLDYFKAGPAELYERWGAKAQNMLDSHWYWLSKNAKHRSGIEKFVSATRGFEPDETPLRVPLRWPLHNVWLGVSVEDQQRADERIPLLLQVPAEVRFLSCEPLLEPVSLKRWAYDRDVAIRKAMSGPMAPNRDQAESMIQECGIHWVIVGGESGHVSRSFDLSWARSLLRQCRDSGIPFFFKQAGSNPCETLAAQDNEASTSRVPLRLRSLKGSTLSEIPSDLRIREWPK